MIAAFAALALPAVVRAQCPDGRPAESCAPRTQRPVPPPANVRARQIVLLPFRNVTRTAANDWLVAGAPLLLGEILGQYRDLQIVPEPRLTAARRRLGISSEVVPDESQRRRIAEETGGWTSVTGNILAIGNTLRISAEAFDAASTSVVARASVEIPAGADIRPAFDRIAVQLLQTAGIVQTGGAATDVVALTTRSIDAYRAYTEGIALLQRGAYRRAETAFRDAVRQDSNFAMAWVKLGTAAIQSRGLADFVNPFGVAALAIERAARATSYVPPRTAAGVRAIRHIFHGEIAQSRAVADSLVATDPEDIDARHWLAIINFFDSRLDPTTDRRFGSMNQSVELSKWVLSRDPGRQEVYLIPAMIYGMGAGFVGGIAGGRRRPVGSLAAEMLTPTDVPFRVTVADTVVLIPDSVFRRWTPAQRAEAHLRAVDAGRVWTQRWMAASPSDAEAHMWASRFEELAGDYKKSLEEFERAIALGAESVVENLRARRLFLYEMTGRWTEAERLADTIIASGTMRTRPFATWVDRSRVTVPAVLIRSKQWDRLASLMATLDTANAACYAVEREMTVFDVTIPAAKLVALADTVAHHFDEVWRSSASSCAGYWSRGFGSLPQNMNRPESARRVLAIGESLHSSGDLAGAYVAARAATFIDSAKAGSVRQTPWVGRLADRLEPGAMFATGRAIVEGDSLTVTFRYLGPDSVLLTTPRGVVSRNFAFMTTPVASDSTVARISFFRAAQIQDSLKYGSLTDFAAGFVSRTGRLLTRGKEPIEAPITVSVAGRALQAVMRGPIVTELRRLRPESGRMLVACPISTSGLCTAQTIAIEYR